MALMTKTTLFILRNFILRRYVRSFYKDVPRRSNIDAVDEFTVHLVQKKMDKWDLIRKNKNIKYGKVGNFFSNNEFSLKEEVNICNFVTNELNDVIKYCLEVRNINKIQTILNQCIEYKKSPSFNIIEEVAMFCVHNNSREILELLKEVAKQNHEEQLKMDLNLDHYLAAIIWIRGNVSESLALFRKVYDNNQFLRRKIKLLLKLLIMDVISERPEAVLVKIIKFTEDLVNVHDDYFLLSLVWQICFLSEWYADQCKADELLEKYPYLITVIVNRIDFIVQLSLRNNKPENVHRLLEVLLRYDLDAHYAKILQALFNYRCKFSRFRLEIIFYYNFYFRSRKRSS